LEGGRGDELTRRCGHHYLHLGAVLTQPSHQIRGLVGGDAPGKPEQNVLALHGCSSSFPTIIAPGLATGVSRAAGIGKSTQSARFLPLADRGMLSLDWPHARLELKVMSIRHWPSAQRPREKLLERGAQALSDAELLGLLLGSGTRGRSAVELARTLIAQFGSLRALLNAEAVHCLAQAGIGPARYAILKAALELARRHFREALRVGPTLAAPEATRTFLNAQLRDRPYEVFCCLYLDNRHRLIAFEELFRGTIDRAGVHPREVLRQTLQHNAAALIFAHNHPSGVLEPSQADQLITRRLKEALALVDVRVLDHFIIGDGLCYSFSEHGLI
jgi:DNA repair protein RadC